MTQSISVSGVGTASRRPDIATVTLGVEVVARSVAEARASAARDAAAVIASLRSGSIEETDITTTAYTINPEYDHREGRRLRGYRISNTVQVVVRDLDSVANVIDGAAAAGSDSTVVHGLLFGFEDSKVLDAEARQAAWEDASRKAEQLAELAGLKLSNAVTISEQSQFAPRPGMRTMAVEAAAATPIEPGEAAVSVTVNVEFAVETA